MKFVARTNVGLIRKNNEDAYYIPDDTDKKFFILADGMGGHLAGERASGLATSVISNELKNVAIESLEDVGNAITNAVIAANKEIFKESEENPEYRGMGTTLSLIYIYEGKLIYVNIGDSRIYEIFDKTLIQLTKDDSFVNYLVDIGEITEEEAKHHPKKNVLTKALGTSSRIGFDIEYKELKKGARYLLCSDGLTGMVKSDYIMQIVNEKSIEKAGDILIDEALQNGGVDNITLILVEIK